MQRRIDFRLPPPDGAFDTVAQLAAARCDAAIGTVTLVDHNGLWGRRSETLFGQPLSQSVYLSPTLVLPKLDSARLGAPETAIEHGLAFYAGVPVRSADGDTLGTLAVLDPEPRPLDDAALADLKRFAAIVADAMELRLQARARLAEPVSLRP